MNKLRLLFAISSVSFLVVLAISPLKDFLNEWKSYQEGYNDYVKTLPQKVKPVEIGVKQVWAQKLDRVDRCITCHVGLEEKALADAPQPFRSHPHIYHNIKAYGCTTCHEGQGPATTREQAHGRVEYWESPLLPVKFMEASCAKCHKEEDVPQAPLLTMGRKLMEESNCVACHKIEGYQKQWAPELDGIGAKVSRAWLVRWLKDPKAYSSVTRMPNFHLSDEEVNLLADFLMSFKSFASDAKLDSVPRDLRSGSETDRSGLVQLGETRFREARCISCHIINLRGGSVATELGAVASKVNLPWLYNYVKDPKHLQPGVEMPRFRFSEHDLTAVVAYMEDEFLDYSAEEPPPHIPDPAYYEKGLALFKKYNCAGCHGIRGMKNIEEMGPELSRIGSKKLYEIDFGKTGIEENLPSYLFTKLKNPRIFSAAMKMPDYQLSDEQARAITVALLGNTNEQILESFKVPPAPPSTFTPQGEFGKLVDDLACFGCHTMNGRGRLVATDLSREASQAQKQWIHNYFKLPYSLRPILTERMPNLFLPEAEIKAIVNYMETVFVADSLDRNVPMDAERISRGKILFAEKFGCQSCHQLGAKGGYVGPPLDHVGSRLKPGWILHWLKDPQSLNPNTIEPKSGVSEKEAEELTAFLMSLK